MSFAINPSLNHIDIPESCVHELYRSSKEILLPDARFHGHTCEAYICIAKNEKNVKAYIALLEMEIKTVFVYTSDFSVSEPANYPEVYANAEAFVKEMGFEMEPVNLNFSPAMREVIIKGFRVMRPPPPKKQPLRQMKAAPVAEPRKLRVEAPPAPATPIMALATDDLATELESLHRELASAKAAITQITREKISLEQSAALEIASLKASCAQAVNAKRKAAELHAAEMEKLRQDESSRAGRLDDEEKRELRAELQAVTAAARTAESSQQAEIASLRQSVEKYQSNKLALEQKLAAAGAATDEQVRRLAAENESLHARIAAEESAARAAADTITKLELVEATWKEGRQREEDLCRNLDLLHNQLDTLAIELQSYKDKEHREEELQLRVNSLEQELEAAEALTAELQTYKEGKECREEELQLRVNSLEQELEAEKAKSEIAGSRETIGESDAAELKVLQEEKMAIEAEYVRLANESREKETLLLDAIAATEAEIERLSNELAIQTQVAALEHAALRAELRKVVVSGATAVAAPEIAATPLRESTPPSSPAAVSSAVHRVEAEAVLPVQTSETAPLPAEPAVQPVRVPSEPEPPDEFDDEPDRPIIPDNVVISRLTNEFGSFGGGGGYESTEFTIDPALTSVPYSDPEEIVVLLYSSNTVQAVPDSSSIQRCKGYVIATQKEGIYRVYVAWYLTESKKVVICAPQHHPADIEECIGILQNAVAYFEIVGFMMEVEDLGESVNSYKRVLKKIPVLRRIKPGV